MNKSHAIHYWNHWLVHSKTQISVIYLYKLIRIKQSLWVSMIRKIYRKVKIIINNLHSRLRNLMNLLNLRLNNDSRWIHKRITTSNIIRAIRKQSKCCRITLKSCRMYVEFQLNSIKENLHKSASILKKKLMINFNREKRLKNVLDGLE